MCVCVYKGFCLEWLLVLAMTAWEKLEWRCLAYNSVACLSAQVCTHDTCSCNWLLHAKPTSVHMIPIVSVWEMCAISTTTHEHKQIPVVTPYYLHYELYTSTQKHYNDTHTLMRAYTYTHKHAHTPHTHNWLIRPRTPCKASSACRWTMPVLHYRHNY